LLKEATENGYTISRISNLDTEKLIELLERSKNPITFSKNKSEYFLEESLKAINDLNLKT